MTNELIDTAPCDDLSTPWRYFRLYTILIAAVIGAITVALFCSISQIKKTAPITLTENDACQYYIDAVSAGRFSLNIAGWAFIKGEESKLHGNAVVLGNSEASYVLPTKLIARKDVTEAFGADGKNRDKSGFFARGFKPYLPKGTYRIYVDCAGHMIDTGLDVER